MSKHVLPKLGDKRLDVLVKSPSLIRSWVAALPVGAAYAQQILADVSAVLDQAGADALIPRNPCKAAAVKAPRVVKRKLVPWTREHVAAIRGALPERYRAMCDVGAGLGLRQGETFGLSLDEVDFLRRVSHVRHQVKLYRAVKPVYGPPTAGRPRTVPLPRQVAEALSEHIRQYPPVEVTLPWQAADGKPRTLTLLFTAEKGTALSRGWFNSKMWVRARRKAGIPDGDDYAAGMHQLRHHYASALLRGGVDIKRVQEYLGHHSAAFTLDVYGHLMADDEDASLRQVEAALGVAEAAGTALNIGSVADGPVRG